MQEIIKVEYKNTRVLTSQQLAEAYETDNKAISYNFNSNKQHYIEGKHYYLLQNEDLKAFREFHELPSNISKLYLWTEKGALLHAKSLNTDRAWEIYDILVETYFKVIQEQNALKLPTNYKEALEHLLVEVNKNEKLQLENSQQQKEIEQLKPKAEYLDKILQSKGLVTITQIAKDYGMSGKQMNKILHDFKVQYKIKNQWLLYNQYDNKGYVHSSTFDFQHRDGSPDTKMSTEWTQKGRIFLYELLKNKGILPLIEKLNIAV